MRLIMVGCEYSGTSTLGYLIGRWVKENLGDEFGFHDHWQIPHVSHPGEPPAGKTRESMIDAFLDGKDIDPALTGHTDAVSYTHLTLPTSDLV